MKKNIITIAGKLGSGKSSAAKGVATQLGYDHYSTGDFARQVAKEHGFTITEWNKYAETNPNLDHEVDDKSRALAHETNLVFDSRLAFHFIPESFKVFLEIDSIIAAQRIYDSLQNVGREEEFQAESVEEMAKDMDERVESEVKRYQNLYGVNHHDRDNFDLVINTGLPENNLVSVINQIIEAYHHWLEK